MAAGIGGALLVFTGVWHALEWLMAGRNRDTLRLIPVGIVYAILGWLIVTGAGWITIATAALFVAAGMAAAFFTRGTAMVRGWVIWAFIAIDLMIVVALLQALLT